MKFALTGAAALLMTAAPVLAGGIERYNQGLAPLFEKGNYVELGFGHVKPSVEGTDVAGFDTGNVSNSYNQIGLAYKRQFTEQLSGLIMLNEPFGADIAYPTAAEGGSPVLGGTMAEVNSKHLTGVLRYVMPNNFGVHGGVNISRADGSVALNGAAYGPVAGYSVDLDNDIAAGWLAGISWEKPEIAARVSLTYHSAIDHEFDTVESGPLVDPDGPGPLPSLPLLAGESTTKVSTPKSWTLDFQTGVAEGTLVFGSIRWVDWSSFKVDPERFVQVTGGGLVDLDDSTTYTLGMGRKLTEEWSMAGSISWEKKGDDLVSPLAPTNGRVGVSLAGIYTRDNMKITTGINYTKLGDASPETGTPDTERARMEDNHAWGVGVRVGYTF